MELRAGSFLQGPHHVSLALSCLLLLWILLEMRAPVGNLGDRCFTAAATAGSRSLSGSHRFLSPPPCAVAARVSP